MQWYFINWDIHDRSGALMNWANSVIESNAKPDEVLKEALESILKDLPEGWTARVVSFSRV